MAASAAYGLGLGLTLDCARVGAQPWNVAACKQKQRKSGSEALRHGGVFLEHVLHYRQPATRVELFPWQ